MSDERILVKYFSDLESVIAAHYALAPSRHASDKGEDREEFLLSVLNNHLPPFARAYRGGVILDVRDRCSSQVDLVVYSSWSPILNQNKKPIFLAQGVFAAIEVKSVLTAAGLREALEASVQIKMLRKFQLPAESGTISFRKTTSSICTGLFAYTSQIKDPEVIFAALKHFHTSGIGNRNMIDFVTVNRKFSLCRDRTEDVDGLYSPTGKTLDQLRTECRYHLTTNAFGPMLATLLSYVSYIGPFWQGLEAYLYHWSQGTDNV